MSASSDVRESLVSTEQWGDLVSPDEDLLASVETNDALHEVDRQFGEVARLEDLAGGLESIACIAEGIEEATIRELQLVHTATALALAGTDVEVESLVPSLESSTGTTVSTESLKRVARTLWDAIRKTVARIWKAIRDFFGGVKGDIQRLRFRNKQVRHRAENVTGRSIRTAKTILGRETNALSIYHRPPRSAKDVIDGLKEYRRQAKVLLGSYPEDLNAMGRKLKNAISSFDITRSRESLARVTAVALEFDLPVKARSAGNLTDVVDSRWESGTVQRLPALMGNKSVFFMTPKHRPGNKTPLAEAEQTRNRRAFLGMSSPEVTDTQTSGEVETFPASTVVEITNLVEEICTLVSEYQSKSKALDNVHRAIESSSQTLVGLMGNSESLSEEDRVHIRSTLKFNTAFSNWANQPQTSFASQALTACRSALIASGKSLTNHM